MNDSMAPPSTEETVDGDPNEKIQLQQKREALKSKKKLLEEQLNQIPSKDLLNASLLHFKNPPQIFIKGNDIFHPEETLLSKYNSNFCKNIGLINTSIILSKLFDIKDKNQIFELTEIERTLQNIKYWSDEDLTNSMEYDTDYLLTTAEKRCLKFPSLIPSPIPLNQSAHLIHHKDEGFLFRKMEEIFTIGEEFETMMDEEVITKFLQIISEKFTIELRCLKTHSDYVDLKNIEDIINCLSIIFEKTIVSKGLICYGVMDLLVEFLNEIEMINNNNFIQLQENIVKFLDKIIKSESAEIFINWFQSGRSITTLIYKMKFEKENIIKDLSEGLISTKALNFSINHNELSNNQSNSPFRRESITSVNDSKYLIRKSIIKHIISIMLTLTRTNTIQSYFKVSMDLEQHKELLISLPSILMNLINIVPSQRRIILKILANLTNIPSICSLIMRELDYLIYVLENLSNCNDDSFLDSVFIIIQLSKTPYIEKDHIIAVACTLLSNILNESTPTSILQYCAVEVSRILSQQQTQVFVPFFVDNFKRAFYSLLPSQIEQLNNFFADPLNENYLLEFLEVFDKSKEEFAELRATLVGTRLKAEKILNQIIEAELKKKNFLSPSSIKLLSPERRSSMVANSPIINKNNKLNSPPLRKTNSVNVSEFSFPAKRKLLF
ncbi:hypothetical protein ABK040_010297 [Willaertia magna]